MILAQDCWYKSLIPLMDSIKRKMGRDRPVYLTFDIDGIDPAFCPGTGNPFVLLKPKYYNKYSHFGKHIDVTFGNNVKLHKII